MSGRQLLLLTVLALAALLADGYLHLLRIGKRYACSVREPDSGLEITGCKAA